MFYDISPMAKPRMTKADAWKKRVCVLKYWAFKDECRLKKVEVPESCEIVFYMAFPLGYTDKQRSTLHGNPHQLKPDLDNLVKAVLDAVLASDQKVWHINAKKIWSTKPGIYINAI